MTEPLLVGKWPHVATGPSGIPEFDDNPLIAQLPPTPSERQLFEYLKHLPPCEPHERNLSPELREQLVFIRCRRLFLPTTQQLRQAGHIDLLIRSGYVARNPATGEYAELMTDLAESAAQDLPLRRLRTDGHAADSMVALGCSGLGKTTLLKKALGAYRQVVPHTFPITMQQLSYVRIDCPGNGSPKQMCIVFFEEVDRLLGTEYLSRFGSLTTDHMLVKMRLVAARHSIGLLAIDEIQHLMNASVGREQVLALLTTMVNVVNVPILMIGTMKAFELFTDAFRTARRGEGTGSLTFEPLPNADEFGAFMKGLFKYQWTAEPTKLTPELINVFWDESQGIVDIVVKLFMLSQMRAIRSGKRSGTEEITAALVQTVAKENLKLVRPMLDALRRKDWVALAKYDDLVDLDTSIALAFASRWDVGGKRPDYDDLAKALEERHASPEGEIVSNTLAATLAASGLTPDQVAAMMKEVARVREGTASHKPPVEGASKTKRGRRPSRELSDRAGEKLISQDPADLRVVLSATDGTNATERLRAANLLAHD